MKDLTLITCSYNTPEITISMLKSFASVHSCVQNLLIIDNSTNEDTAVLLKGLDIQYIKNKGGTHGDGVNMAIELCKTKYALLVDTDVIFIKNHNDIFEQFKSMDLTLMGKVEGDRGGKSIYNRVNPWHCFIDIEKIKQNNIKFFDAERMKNSFGTNKIYDIGSTFFSDIKDKKLRIGDIDLHNKYYIHMEGMSWYKNKYNPDEKDTGIDFGGTHNNPNFVKAYEYKYTHFKNVMDRYSTINIKNKFICKQPKLLVKFPTRDRVDKFFPLLDTYYNLLSNKHDVSFLVTCDIDDITMNNDDIKNRFKKYKNLIVEYGNNTNKIMAINSGLSDKNFDIVLLASDDMVPQIKGYDDIIIDNMVQNFPDFDGIVWFNDGVQQNRLNTLCILGKKYYDRFGYIYNPEYKSLWCDMEFTIVGNILNKQRYFNDCIIKHEHHSVTGIGFDKLYDLNEKNESKDKETFIRRKSINFGL